MTGVTVLSGLIAGFLVSGSVRISDTYWTNAAVLTAIGGALGFIVGFLFISPVRLWREAEIKLAAALADQDHEVTSTFQIGHIEQFLNVSGPGPFRVANGSNTVFVSAQGEGPLFPRGTIADQFEIKMYAWQGRQNEIRLDQARVRAWHSLRESLGHEPLTAELESTAQRFYERNGPIDLTEDEIRAYMDAGGRPSRGLQPWNLSKQGPE
jgi:hypothetical protein